MKTLRRQWLEEIYVQILKDVYKESTATIKLHKISENIPIQKGVKQGDTIFPKLFKTGLE